MNPSLKTFSSHLAVLALFALTALLYFYPVLQGKAIFQSDIAQYKGMAHERDTYRDTTGEESYWTNSAFGGMPTYQLGAQYPHDYIKKLDKLIRFLPRPADYLFLYLLGFYILMLCLRVKYRLAVLGALAFGFSTYLIVILGVGHNAKAHALGYIPMVLGGIVLLFRKKYLLGFVLTALALALEISANHYQMTYYFLLLILVLGIVEGFHALKRNALKPFFTAVSLLVLAAGLSVGANATPLMATQQYAQWSTRGTSSLTVDPQGSPMAPATGLNKEYITQYSYGVLESLNLFVPRLMGGSNSEAIGKTSKTYAYLIAQGVPPTQASAFANALPLYWGAQPIVAAPAYIGAVVCFLFVLALFLVRGQHKKWLVAGALLALLLSWGKNFSLLTNVMIDYVPLYNKFRAVSSIQVVLALCVPVLGILGLRALCTPSVPTSQKLKALKNSTLITLGLGGILLLLKGFLDFEGVQDDTYRSYWGDALVATLQSDREAVYTSDTLRTLLYVGLTAAVLWGFLKEKIRKNLLLLSIGILIVCDLVGVAHRYVNAKDFVRQSLVSTPFQATAVDQRIQQDTTLYRVLDPQEGLNGARTSYFHHSLGGYHAAKPRAMQELFDYHVYQNNAAVLHMFNVKYLIQQNEAGERVATLNPEANGNAWFVARLLPVSTADEAIQQLKDVNIKKEAILNTQTYPQVTELTYPLTSQAALAVVDYQPNRITYRASNPHAGFAVFSEMHYPAGWQAFVDGEPAPHYKVNYALRGMPLPAGEHQITFRFTPEVVQTASRIALASCVLLALLVVGGIGYGLRYKT